MIITSSSFKFFLLQNGPLSHEISASLSYFHQTWLKNVYVGV